MKIYVSQMPREPKECLFARKEQCTRIFDDSSNKWINIHQYYCNVNNKLCNLYCNERCSKLRVVEQTCS